MNDITAHQQERFDDYVSQEEEKREKLLKSLSSEEMLALENYYHNEYGEKDGFISWLDNTTCEEITKIIN